MSSGVNAVDMDWTWDCPACEQANEDVAVWKEGDVITATCEKCQHETEINV